MSLEYVHHPVEVAGIALTTFGLGDTTTTMSPPDEDYSSYKLNEIKIEHYVKENKFLGHFALNDLCTKVTTYYDVIIRSGHHM